MSQNRGKQNGHPVKIDLIYIHEQQKSTIKYYCTCIRHFFTTYIENLPCIGRMLQCTCSQTPNENCEDQQYIRKSENHW